MKSYLPWWPDCVSVAPDTAPPVCSLPSPPSCAQSVTGLSPLLPNDFTGEKKYLVCEGGCQDKNLSWHAVKIRGIEICITEMMIRMCFLISRDHWVYLGRSTWSNRIYVQKLYLLIKKKIKSLERERENPTMVSFLWCCLCVLCKTLCSSCKSAYFLHRAASFSSVVCKLLKALNMWSIKKRIHLKLKFL